MTTLTLSRHLSAPPQAVYDHVTRPARWHTWHPASLGAEAHAEHSLSAGQRFEEDVRSAGFKRHLRWQVLESQPGQLWAARGEMADGTVVHLRYEFAGEGSGTRFTRTLDYRVGPTLLRWINDLLLWRRVAAESTRALDNLAAHFEKHP